MSLNTITTTFVQTSQGETKNRRPNQSKFEDLTKKFNQYCLDVGGKVTTHFAERMKKIAEILNGQESSKEKEELYSGKYEFSVLEGKNCRVKVEGEELILVIDEEDFTEGGSVNVRKASQISTKVDGVASVALKLPLSSEAEYMQHVVRTVEVVNEKMDHDNLSIKDAVVFGDAITEPLCRSSINRSLKNPPSFESPVADRKRWVKQLYNVMKLMHGKNWLHRDMKPHNILLDRQRNIKLTDFGCSLKSSNVNDSDRGFVPSEFMVHPTYIDWLEDTRCSHEEYYRRFKITERQMYFVNTALFMLIGKNLDSDDGDFQNNEKIEALLSEMAKYGYSKEEIAFFRKYLSFEQIPSTSEEEFDKEMSVFGEEGERKYRQEEYAVSPSKASKPETQPKKAGFLSKIGSWFKSKKPNGKAPKPLHGVDVSQVRVTPPLGHFSSV